MDFVDETVEKLENGVEIHRLRFADAAGNEALVENYVFPPDPDEPKVPAPPA